MCPQHNAYLTEREYGKKKMDRYRKKRTRVLEAAPAYGSLEVHHTRVVKS
jgi:hypothetical protein